MIVLFIIIFSQLNVIKINAAEFGEGWLTWREKWKPPQHTGFGPIKPIKIEPEFPIDLGNLIDPEETRRNIKTALEKIADREHELRYPIVEGQKVEHTVLLDGYGNIRGFKVGGQAFNLRGEPLFSDASLYKFIVTERTWFGEYVPSGVSGRDVEDALDAFKSRSMSADRLMRESGMDGLRRITIFEEALFDLRGEKLKYVREYAIRSLEKTTSLPQLREYFEKKIKALDEATLVYDKQKIMRTGEPIIIKVPISQTPKLSPLVDPPSISGEVRAGAALPGGGNQLSPEERVIQQSTLEWLRKNVSRPTATPVPTVMERLKALTRFGQAARTATGIGLGVAGGVLDVGGAYQLYLESQTKRGEAIGDASMVDCLPCDELISFFYERNLMKEDPLYVSKALTRDSDNVLLVKDIKSFLKEYGLFTGLGTFHDLDVRSVFQKLIAEASGHHRTNPEEDCARLRGIIAYALIKEIKDLREE